MAITGGGTLSNPYLVNNYTDLNAICKGHGTYWTLGSRVYIKFTGDIWGTGVDWDLSTYSETVRNQEQTNFYYNVSPFVIDMNGYSIVNAHVTTGLLFPVPKMYGHYAEGGAFLISGYYGQQLSKMTIIKNGSIVDLTLSDLSDMAIYSTWLVNVQFINANVTNHGVSDNRSHPAQLFTHNCMIDRCVVIGSMTCQNRGEITAPASRDYKQSWFSWCTILHSDLCCNMFNAGEYVNTLTEKNTLTPYKCGGDVGWGVGGNLVNTQVWKTRMRGKITGTGDFYKFIDHVTQYNVLDFDMNDCVQVVGTNRNMCMNGRAGSNSKNVCNTDNLPNMSTSTLAVTSSQITNGAALRQLGFPVTNIDIW